MNEQWEMCLIEVVNKMIYKSLFTPKGVERIQLHSQEQRDKIIVELLVMGWEPFAVVPVAPDIINGHVYPLLDTLCFRRRIS